MGMNILLWIVFGALVGWIASIIMRTNDEMGSIANVIVGIVGAFIGGMVSRTIGGEGVNGFNLQSLFVSIIGASLLLFLLRMITHRRGSTVNH